MDNLNIICTVIGTSVAIVGCLGTYMRYLFNKTERDAVNRKRLDDMEERMKQSPCESHSEDIATHREKIARIDKVIEKLDKLPCESHSTDLTEHKERIARLDRLIEKLDKLPCEGHKESISENRRTIDRITSTLNENKEMLVRLSKWAMKVDNSLIDSLSVKCSPMRMTKSGEHLYKLSGADKALDKMKEKLIEGIENASPRTEYDVEDLAYEMLIRNMGDIALDPVKRFVYYSPDKLHIDETGEDIRFDLYSILRLMGIRLRDIYLETHKELIEKSGNDTHRDGM